MFAVGYRLTLAALFIGPLLVIVRFLLARSYQPNELPLAKRLELGRAQAVLLDDLPTSAAGRNS